MNRTERSFTRRLAATGGAAALALGVAACETDDLTDDTTDDTVEDGPDDEDFGGDLDEAEPDPGPGDEDVDEDDDGVDD